MKTPLYAERTKLVINQLQQMTEEQLTNVVTAAAKAAVESLRESATVEFPPSIVPPFLDAGTHSFLPPTAGHPRAFSFSTEQIRTLCLASMLSKSSTKLTGFPDKSGSMQVTATNSFSQDEIVRLCREEIVAVHGLFSQDSEMEVLSRSDGLTILISDPPPKFRRNRRAISFQPPTW